MAEYKSINEHVENLVDKLRAIGVGVSPATYAHITTMAKELARDQRHCCAEAVQGQYQQSRNDKIDAEQTYQAVFNARIKEK